MPVVVGMSDLLSKCAEKWIEFDHDYEMSRQVCNDQCRTVNKLSMGQVKDLTHTLHETDRNITRNEELL